MSAFAVGALGSLASGMMQMDLNERNRLAQKEENQKSRNFADKQTRESMLYNSPAFISNRLKAAGINPSSQNMTGGMNTSSPVMGTVPPGTAPFQGLGDNLINGLNSDVANRKIKVDTDKTQAETEKIITDRIISLLNETRNQSQWRWTREKEGKQLKIAEHDYLIRKSLADLEHFKFTENQRQFNENMQFSYDRLKQELDLANQQYFLDKDRQKLEEHKAEIAEKYERLNWWVRYQDQQEKEFQNFLERSGVNLFNVVKFYPGDRLFSKSADEKKIEDYNNAREFYKNFKKQLNNKK